jgi:DNA polymerase III subunit epsilon
VVLLPTCLATGAILDGRCDPAEATVTFHRLLTVTLLAFGLTPAVLLLIVVFEIARLGGDATTSGVLVSGAAFTIVVLVAALFAARSLHRPLNQLQDGLSLVAGPNPSHRLGRRALTDLSMMALEIDELADRAERTSRDAQAQLVAATRNLAVEKDTLASILFALVDGVVVTNASLQVVLSNAAARRMLSLPAVPLRRGESIYTYLEPSILRPHLEALSRQLGPLLEQIELSLPSGEPIRVSATLAGSDELERHYVLVLHDALPVDPIAAPTSTPRWAVELPLVELLAAATDRLSERLSERSQEVKAAGLPLATLGDRSALVQVVARLIELASARAPEGAQISAAWRLLGEAKQAGALVELVIQVPGSSVELLGGERILEAPLARGVVDWTESVPTLRSVAREHGGELLIRSVEGQAAYVLRVPAAPRAAQLAADLEADAVGHQVLALLGREGFFHPRPRAVHDSPRHADAGMSQLSFVVFDLETTGLEPSAGDEIISLGAVRVRGGEVIREDHFLALVQPRRPIPAASTRVHGITDAMVAGRPRLGEVLPHFVQFLGDSVPVAHVASFDLAFLNPRLTEGGLPPIDPDFVLDTLLLTYSLFPASDGFNLEEIAERFGLAVIGRHTALGDALTTAEILVRLLDVLDQRGVRTLGQALKLQSGDALQQAIGAVRARLAWG